MCNTHPTRLSTNKCSLRKTFVVQMSCTDKRSMTQHTIHKIVKTVANVFVGMLGWWTWHLPCVRA